MPFLVDGDVSAPDNVMKEVCMNWYFQGIIKYAVNSGRARRKEFWYFTLFHIIIFMVLGLIDYLFGIPNRVSLLYAAAGSIPHMAVAVRRLHDTGRSGWWILINSIPFIGSIIMLFFLVSESQPGTNQYGPSSVDEQARKEWLDRIREQKK